MKKLLKSFLQVIDAVGAVILNWFFGLIIFLFISFLSFCSFLIGGKAGLIRFYKDYGSSLDYEEEHRR